MHKHIKFCSFKHYLADLFKEILTRINFPNYQNFNDTTEAIFNKKKDYIENKLNECIGKLKDLWKALKSLGLPKKIS